jgi:hypothetical protein
VGKYQKKVNRFSQIQKVVICVIIFAIVIMTPVVSQRVKYEKQIAEINANHEAEMAVLRAELQNDYESKITELEQYYEYGGDVSQIEREAEYIAKVIYGTARNHVDSDKKAVVWCILNRVEHYAHPDTIAEVCEQPKQWMGYSSDNPVLTENYDLALAELKTWYNDGHRPMSSDYIYLSWSSKEILLRDTFEENKSTHYWRMR